MPSSLVLERPYILIGPTPTTYILNWVFQLLCMDVRVALETKLSAEELMLLNCGAGEDS